MGEDYVTVAEFVNELARRGLRFNAQTIRQWIRAGRIHAIRPGRRQWFIPREEVDRVLRGEAENGRSPLVLAAR